MQTIVVIIILVLTLAFVVRWVVRTVRGKGGGCNCGCSGCPKTGGKECHCGDKCAKLPEIKVDD